ncbi:MAG: DsbA family protein [Microgenomates group bacterium]
MENKKIEISQSAAMFVGLLMMVMVGTSGYLYGKVNSLEKSAGTAQPQAAQPAQQAAQPQATMVTQDQLKELFDGKNITFGDKNKKLVFVEFSDPSCPFCHVAAGKNGALNKQMGSQFILKADGGAYVAPVAEMKKLVDKKKASFVWIYANGHGNGEMGTKAFYCAQEKGKFWQVHDLLMNEAGYELMNTTVKNDKTQSDKVAEFLKSAVDAKFMKECLDSGRYEDRLATDMATAQKFGFNGTPSFFVNTQNFAGAYSYTDMKSAVDAAL